MPDHLNVDVDPRFKPDIISDIRSLELADGQFEEITASDIIEKITLAEARVFTRKMLGWLRPSGVLKIHTVNMPQCCLRAARDDHEALKWLYATDGEGSTNYPSNIVRWAYSDKSLKALLEGVGFRVLQSQTDCLGYGLTMVAVKP